MSERSRRNFLVALTIGVAATRLLASSHSIWDWDEALFCSALRHYNVANHNPHPPGFPLFIALAKVVRLMVHDEFRALRTLNLLVSFAVFPAMYALARALRFEFRSAVVAGLIYSFLPNVWFWGGTAMSDISSIVFFLIGAAMLLRDDRRLGLFFAGSAIFAASMLVRPQNVVMLYPFLVASWRQVRLRGARGTGITFAAGLMIAAIVVGGYGAAALKTGWTDYINATRAHQHYVSAVDGYGNPNRPPSVSMIYAFWVDPFDAGRVSKLLVAFALIAFLRPRRRNFEIVGIFGPVAVFALFMLNPTFVSRFAVAYMPMHALLAADGMEVVGRVISWRGRQRERMAAALQTIIAAVVIGRYVYWVWPALREVHRHDSPPVAAMRWILQHVPRATGRIYVHGSMSPFADYFLAGYQQQPVADEVDPSMLLPWPDGYYTADHASFDAKAVNFRRPRKKLWSIFHRRYFEVCVVPVAGWTKLVEGWYGQESGKEGEVWRWMGGRSRTLLQGLGKPGRLELHFYVPIDAESPPTVRISIDGELRERFVAAKAYIDRMYDLPPRAGTAHELVIDVDRTVNPARLHRGSDTRDLGLQLRSISWKARP